MKLFSVKAAAVTCTAVDGPCRWCSGSSAPCSECLLQGLGVGAASAAMGTLVMLACTVLKVELNNNCLTSILLWGSVINRETWFSFAMDPSC